MTKYLDDIVQYLSYNPIRLDNHLDDGRLNSAGNENEI